MSYKDMTAVEYGEKLRKIMKRGGRKDQFCRGVDCIECKKQFNGLCVFTLHKYDFEKAAKVVYEYPLSILSDKEKQYILGKIKDYKDLITQIVKKKNGEKELFIAELNNGETICFPHNKTRTMCLDMILDKQYTLEELNL